jgi:hypothetical protein
MSESSLQSVKVQRTDFGYSVGRSHVREGRRCNVTEFEVLRRKDEVTAVGAQIRVSRLCKGREERTYVEKGSTG